MVKGGREERNISVWLPLAHPLLGTWPATQACALMGIRTTTLRFAAGRRSIYRDTPARAHDVSILIRLAVQLLSPGSKTGL